MFNKGCANDTISRNIVFVESGSDIALKKKIPDLEIRYTMDHQTRLRSHLSAPARFALCIPAFYEGGQIGPVVSQIYVITGSEGKKPT